MLGVPTVTIDRTVRLAVAGLNVGKFSDENGDDVKILLTKGNAGTPTLDALNNLYVNTSTGSRDTTHTSGRSEIRGLTA